MVPKSGRYPSSIRTFDECASAAAALGLSDTTPTRDGSQGAIDAGLSYLTDPPECYMEYRSDWGGFPGNFGRRLFIGGGGGGNRDGRLFWDSACAPCCCPPHDLAALLLGAP